MKTSEVGIVVPAVAVSASANPAPLTSKFVEFLLTVISAPVLFALSDKVVVIHITIESDDDFGVMLATKELAVKDVFVVESLVRLVPITTCFTLPIGIALVMFDTVRLVIVETETTSFAIFALLIWGFAMF